MQDMPGTDEIIQGMLNSLSPEQRLAGLLPKDRVAGLAPQELSLHRPTMLTYPSPSIVARSPVCIQPEGSMAARVAASSFQEPSMTLSPRVQGSPELARGTTAPVGGSTTLTSTWGGTRPTVPTGLSSAWSMALRVETGEVSVMP